MVLAQRVRKELAKAARGSALPRSIKAPMRESYRYGDMIIQTAQQYPRGPMRDRLNLTLLPVNQWLANLARLEAGLAKLYSQRNLSRELRQTGLKLTDYAGVC